MCHERRPGQGRSTLTGCTEQSYDRGGEACYVVAEVTLTLTLTLTLILALALALTLALTLALILALTLP